MIREDDKSSTRDIKDRKGGIDKWSLETKGGPGKILDWPNYSGHDQGKGYPELEDRIEKGNKLLLIRIRMKRGKIKRFISSVFLG